jgi:hypothetical protein
MSQADRMTNGAGAGAPYHTVSHYGSPDAVLSDHKLSSTEKRVILSSWASDIYAVESNPALRAVPGLPRPLRLGEILAALQALDGEDGPRPRGGAAMRPVRPMSLDAIGCRADHQTGRAARAASVPLPKASSWDRSRWTREANIGRYRRLLATQLTDHERRFVEQRLVEELRGASAGTNPGAVDALERQSSYSAEMSRPV